MKEELGSTKWSPKARMKFERLKYFLHQNLITARSAPLRPLTVRHQPSKSFHFPKSYFLRQNTSPSPSATTSTFLIPTSNFKNTSSILIHNSYFKTIIMKIFKDMKTWKTIIQFIITVLTAIISSFFVQSCKTGF